MTKIAHNLKLSNQNRNGLNKKESDSVFFNLNKNDDSFSKIIGDSGWYNISAEKPNDVNKSALGDLNNVLVAPYLFIFDVDLEEHQLKNLNFVIETKTSPSLVAQSLTQWSATNYTLDSDGYKIYTPTLVWKGGIPGNALSSALPDMTVPYYGTACRIQYNFFTTIRSNYLRRITWLTLEEYWTPPPIIYLVRDVKTYTMTKFNSASDINASGYGYYTRTITNFPSFGQTTYDSDFRALSCNYISDNVGFQAGDETWDSIALADMLDVYETNSIQGYYDSNYYWHIIYDNILNKLVHLPYEIVTPNYPIVPSIPSDLYLTIRENAVIEADDDISSSGITATGQSFFYVKKPNGRYEVRIVGGVVYTTNIVEGDDTTLDIEQENYNLISGQWTYDDTEVIGTLDTPYYNPQAQDVQIKCLLNYIPEIKHQDYDRK